MTFNINKDSLIDGLQKLLGPTTSKQNLPILTCVLIEAKDKKIKLTSTDLDTSIITFLEANVITQGKIAVPIRNFFSIIKELSPGEITVEESKKNLLIKCEKTEFKINCFKEEDFPKIKPAEKVPLIKIYTQDIAEIIKMTSFCVGFEETNYVLNGILFEIKENKIKAVSTDGKRLAFIEKELPKTQSEIKTKIEFILPVKAALELQKIIKEKEEEIYFFVEKNRVGFDLKDTILITRPIEGEFPQYKQYLPEKLPFTLEISRRDFLSSVKRAALLSTLDYQGIKIELKKEEAVVTKTTPQVGEFKDTVFCKYSGKNLTIGFNPHYLIDVLKNIEEEKIEIGFEGADRPAVVKNENYTYLILPMKI